MRNLVVAVVMVFAASVAWAAPRQEKPLSLAAADNQNAKRLTVSLKVEASEPHEPEVTTLMAKVRAAEKEIESLKADIAMITREKAQSDKMRSELASLVALYESAGDIRLIKAVETRSEDAFFAGIGDVRMAEDNGRVIFRLQGDSVGLARKLFSRVERNFIDAAGCSYVILDKQILNAN